MTIKEIEILFSEDLANINLDANLKENIQDGILDDFEMIGIPKLILDKFEGQTDLVYENGIVVFSKSNLSDIKLGLQLSTKNVICFSEEYNSSSFMNTNYMCFVRCVFVYEILKQLIIIPQKLGDYYEFHQNYAERLQELINEIDSDAIKNGVWYNLIEEMKLGVI
jgi:hypothetical protein